MPLSIDQYVAATSRYPDATPLGLEKDNRIVSTPLPSPSFLSLFGLGGFHEAAEKQYAIIVDFKKTLMAKYGSEIASFAFPPIAHEKASVHGLQKSVVSKALKDAEIITLLRDAIIESMEQHEEEPPDSPFTTVAGEGALLFSEATLTAVKKAYHDTDKALADFPQNFRVDAPSPLVYRSPASQEKARQAIIRDLNRREHHSPTSPDQIRTDLVITAMRLAMETSPEVKERMYDLLKPPVTARAEIIRNNPLHQNILAEVMGNAAPDAMPVTHATPLAPAIAMRIDDAEWNI